MKLRSETYNPPAPNRLLEASAGRQSLLARHWLLLLVVLLALLLRVVLWGNLPRTGLISDEAEYLAAADWLAHGRGFTWHQQWLWTRAPLYPLFLAGHLRLFGLNLPAIYATQTLLSLLNVGLVYQLALLISNASGIALPQQRRVAAGAGLCAALYLPFALYAQMLLSETLFLTLMLGSFVALGIWAAPDGQPGSRRDCVALTVAGGLLGLATLTRGLTLGFLPPAALWVFLAGRRHRNGGTADRKQRRATVALLLFLGSALVVILPWSLYASRLYGGRIVVDTTGAYNLMLGARTAYDGERRDAPPRNFVLALLDPQLTPAARRALLEDACLRQQDDPRLLAALDRPVSEITQGQRQQLMLAEGLCLLQAKPGAFVDKSLGEFIDLFQINYTGAERLTDGFTLGWLPRPYTLALFLLDDTLYVLILPLAVLGWARQHRAVRRPPTADRNSRFSVLGSQFSVLSSLMLFWWLYNLLTAPLLFAINRFRLPLLPFAFIFAAYFLLANGKHGNGERKTAGERSRGVPGVRHLSLALALLLALIAGTPYAYLEPRPAGADSDWASYLGPYPSSLASSIIAWNTRPAYRIEQQVQAALHRGDVAEVRALLATGAVPPYVAAVARPLLAGLAGEPAAGLAQLEQQAVKPLASWQTTLVRGELLRRMGEWEAARQTFSPTAIDDQNPVAWAWEWLHPPPLPDNRLDLAGDLDLGYIKGFYLGEGDPDVDGTFRWSGPEARLRFPQAGSGQPQDLCLRADGRGWPDDLAQPTFRLLRDAQTLATFELQRAVQVYCARLPAGLVGSDVVITLQADTFVPGAADLLGQQGPQVGQLRFLGVRLDWAELTNAE
ncbi:MAG: ArnT family glycosyltransferase [Chloroflexaceae bacterium]